MKHILLSLLLIASFTLDAQRREFHWHRIMADSTHNSVAGFDETGFPKLFTLGPGLSLTDGVLNATGGATFTEDVPVVLSDGKSFGKYTNGQTAPWTGLTVVEALIDAMTEYIAPEFTSFSISQTSPVEVGTTLTGPITFTWSTAANSGTITTLDLFQLSYSVVSPFTAGIANDGTSSEAIQSIKLDGNGQVDSFWLRGNTINPVGTFQSNVIDIIARYYRFFGASSATPTNSAEVRALTSSAFHTGATTFTLNTGSTQTKFIVALPPGVTISSVTDLDALGAVITSQYVLNGTISVTDAGGTSRSYNLYEMNIADPYSSSHRHSITTAN